MEGRREMFGGGCRWVGEWGGKTHWKGMGRTLSASVIFCPDTLQNK
jgi:hypothetical protein